MHPQHDFQQRQEKQQRQQQIPKIVTNNTQHRQKSSTDKAVLILACIQVLVTVLSVGLGIAVIKEIALEVLVWSTHTCSGVWFGLWYLAVGIIGTCSACHAHIRGLRKIVMFFNISTVFVGLVVISLDAISLAYFASCEEFRFNILRTRGPLGRYITTGYKISGDNQCLNKAMSIGMYSGMIMIDVTEIFISLIISVLCIRAHGWCGNREPNGDNINQVSTEYHASDYGNNGFQQTTNFNRDYREPPAY